MSNDILPLWNTYETFCKKNVIEGWEEFVNILADSYRDDCQNDFADFLLYLQEGKAYLNVALPWWHDNYKKFLVTPSLVIQKLERTGIYILNDDKMFDEDRKGDDPKLLTEWLYKLAIKLEETPWRKELSR